jgi:hypothetical protein
MSDNKKSFILYTDLKSVVEKLITKDREDGTNNTGELFYHILKYVNDEDPKPSNFIIEMAFESIKLQLKRDLIKYEEIKEKNRQNALSRWVKARKKDSKDMQSYATANDRIIRNANDADNGIDNEIDNDIKDNIIKKESEFKESIKPFIQKYGKDICNDFYMYWSEPDKSRTKLRYELQKTWDVGRRLAYWANRDKTFNPKSNGTDAVPNYQKL